MARPGHTCIISAIVIALGGSTDAQAWDWLSLYPFEAEAILRFDGTDRSSDTGADGTDTDWRFGVRLTQEAYTLDPAIARYMVELEPTWMTGEIKTGDVADKRSGNFLNYLIQADVMQGTPGPVGFDLSFLQSEDRNSGSLGSRYDNRIQEQVFGVRWKNHPFPMRMELKSRSFQQEFRSTLDAPISKRDEKLDTLRLVGRSSKMDIRIEHHSMDDRVPERDNDYDLDRATLGHRLPWGNGSNLRSWWDYYDRTGFNANRRITITEEARINHTDSLYSNSTYTFRQVTQVLKTTEHNGRFRLNHNLYGNLRTEGDAGGLVRNSEAVDETQWRVGFRSNYNKGDMVVGGDLGALLGLTYQLTDRDSKLGLVEVVDEAHVVPVGGDVILNQRFVVMATIIVTDETGELVYTRGFDYEVFDLSSDLTQVQAVPGGRIETGNTILVSYKAQALPSMEYSTTFTTFGLNYSLPWMRFRHYSSRTDNNLLSGEGESFLTDRQDTITHLEFNWLVAEIDTSVSAERRYTEINDFESTAYTFREQFMWAATDTAQLNLLALQQFEESTDRNTDLYSMELSINWRPLNGLHIRPLLGAWKREDTGVNVSNGQRDDRFVTAGVKLRWFYRKVIFDMNYYINQRTINLSETNENRLWFALSRSF